MSSSIAIRVENLGKRYRIGQSRKRHDTLRDLIASAFRRGGHRPSATEDTIWALKDVSFEVNQGEVIGIIGRNGAGKSTLLKILSRITDPTEGFAEIHGRCSSLLEVGTGFHPELTGRENIYLNGSILGMKRAEITGKFDEIVAFAEVEKFIDTPVKHYSSGMYVRLAFAVAAHLEPEIMVVDEVLAVGDIEFQRKCLGKMGDISKEGRTVVFVSHHMGSIRSLCNKAIWMDMGRIKDIGEAARIVRQYEGIVYARSDKSVFEREPRDVTQPTLHFSRVELMNCSGQHTNRFTYGEKLVLLATLGGESPAPQYSVEFRIWTESGQFISVGASGAFHGIYFDRTVKQVRIEIGPLILTDAKYVVSLSVLASAADRTDTWENACYFNITECHPFPIPFDVGAPGCVLQQSFIAVD